MTMNKIDILSKNFLINGMPFYSQRIGLAAALVTVTPTYFFDRWLTYRAGNWSGSPAIQKQSVSIAGYPRLNKAIVTSGANAVDATATLVHEQRIESVNAIDIAGEYASFKFHYNESEFQDVDIEFFSADVEDDFSAVTQIGITETRSLLNDSTDQVVTVEKFLMSADLARGLLVRITLKNPENTGVNITSNLTGFKLNYGEKAQLFSYSAKDLIHEFISCQRYYQKSYDVNTTPGTVTGNGSVNIYKTSFLTSLRGSAHFRVRMRAVPIIDLYSISGVGPGFIEHDNIDTAASISATGETGFTIATTPADATFHKSTFQWVAKSEL